VGAGGDGIWKADLRPQVRGKEGAGGSLSRKRRWTLYVSLGLWYDLDLGGSAAASPSLLSGRQPARTVRPPI
jgi:hypothetical protein